jgi:inhibitor of KinA sporulation pathway (predicted exonuclease)
MFDRDCRNKGVTYPFGGFHINIKGVIETIFGENLGMADALPKMGITLDGTHHRGMDDAYNIAKMYKWVLARARNVSL